MSMHSYLTGNSIVRVNLFNVLNALKDAADFRQSALIHETYKTAYQYNMAQHEKHLANVRHYRAELKVRISGALHHIGGNVALWRHDDYGYKTDVLASRKSFFRNLGEDMGRAIAEDDGEYFINHVYKAVRNSRRLRGKLLEVFGQKASCTIYQCDKCGDLSANDDDWSTVLDSHNNDSFWCSGCVEDDARYSDKQGYYIADDDALPLYDSYNAWENDDPDDWVTHRWLTRSHSYYSAERCSGNGQCAVDEDTYSMINRDDDDPSSNDEPDVQGYHGWRIGHIASDYDNRRQAVLLGIEMEFEFNDNEDMHEAVEALKNKRMHQTYYVLERDGSLQKGFEAITGYTGLDVHREKLKLMLDRDDTLYQNARTDARSNGTHVHVSKAGATYWHLTKMASFIYNPDNRAFMDKLAGRRMGGEYNTVVDYLYHAKTVGRRHAEFKNEGYNPQQARANAMGCNTDWSRYGALSTETSTGCTVEFRMFRGSTDYEEILAWAEFSFATWHFSQQCGMAEMNPEQFVRFVYRPDNRGDTINLRKYLEQNMAHQRAIIEAQKYRKKTDKKQTTLALAAT